MTTPPLQVGVGALVEVGPGVRFGYSFGTLPRPYVGAINTFIGELEPTYSAEEAALIESSLQKSVVMRWYGGWRPWEKVGLYGHLGGSFIGLGGGASAADLLEVLLELEIPEGSNREDRLDEMQFVGQANLFLFDTELGWDQPVWKGLSLRMGLGWSFTVASNTTLSSDRTVDNPLAQGVVDAIEEQGADYLDAVFRAYAHPPTATVAIGWRIP